MDKEARKRRLAFRDYTPGDEAHITALFERVFGKTMGPTESLRHWRWEFQENPAAREWIRLAWDGPHLAGQYTSSPMRMAIEGQEVLAGLSHDTMTDPEYGGLGIFTKTARELYERMEADGARFIYGFPNANSIGGFTRRLGWHRVMPTPVWLRPVAPFGLVGAKLRLPLSPLDGVADALFGLQRRLSARRGAGIDVHEEAQVGDWADELWARCRPQHRIWVIRDQRYLSWRYGARPETRYTLLTAWRGGRIAGFLALAMSERGGQPVGFVMDLLADVTVDGCCEALLDAAALRAREMGAALMSAMVTPGCRYRRAFLSRAFIPLPERLFPKQLHFGARAFGDGGDTELISDPRAWLISWGDVDVL